MPTRTLVCFLVLFLSCAASERNLDSIKFSEKESSNSPDIRVKLFKSDTFGGGGEDNGGKRKGKKTKSSRAAAAAKTAAAKKTPTKRQKTTYSYKSTPTSDDSIDQQTDNDNTFNASSDEDTLSHGDESDLEGLKRGKTSQTRDGDLSYVQDILNDAGDDNPSGVRRSKRKRFKPLAWYKGEHYVYERRESGVGLVIPTVAGIERAGTTTPTKTARKYSRKSSNTQRRTAKPFPKSNLPKVSFVVQEMRAVC